LLHSRQRTTWLDEVREERQLSLTGYYVNHRETIRNLQAIVARRYALVGMARVYSARSEVIGTGLWKIKRADFVTTTTQNRSGKSGD
jgi:hypothetical protein